MTTTVLTTADQVRDLPRGRVFSMRLPKTMSWKDLHRVLYYTANREVRLTLRDGTRVIGVLDEAPGFFAADDRLWLRVAGRKTRKPIKPREIRHMKGYRAPTLAEAFTALVGATCSNPSPELAAETQSIISDM